MPAPLPSALRARFEEYIAEGLSGRAAAARLKCQELLSNLVSKGSSCSGLILV